MSRVLSLLLVPPVRQAVQTRYRGYRRNGASALLRRLMFMRQIVDARLTARGRLRLLRFGRFFVRRVVVQQDVIILRPLRQRRRRLMGSRLNGAGRWRSRRSGLRRGHGFFACGIEMAE